MDSKKIKAILTAVDLGSLNAASKVLEYTQPGLSNMMNALEDELGLNLLVRSKSGVQLSPAGQELLPRMEALLTAAEELERGAEQLRRRSFTTLRLGAYSSVARQWIPSVLAAFRQVSPDTDVVMEVGGIVDIYEKLRSDQLDCAVVSYQENLCQGLQYIPLEEDALLAILPSSYELKGDRFPLSEFAGKEFLMPSSGFDLDINPLFGGSLERVASRVRHTNLDDGAIVSMVELGLGVSILSELIMQDMSLADVQAVPLDPPSSRRLGIALSEKRAGGKNIRRFVRCAQAVLEELYHYGS